MRSIRLILRSLPVLLLLVALSPVPAAFADVGPSIDVKWSGPRPEPARPGQETVGRFELSVVDPGIVENLELSGEGWTVNGFDSPRRLVLPRDARREITFRAVPTDPHAPLVVTGTIGGIPFRREFRLDADYLDKLGKPGKVRMQAAPVLSGTKAGARTIAGGRNIRFHGRFMYNRQGTELVGADNIVVRIMDDDSPFSDEEIGRFLTDSDGNFDQTIFWDDCDILGCDDPDIYVIYEAANLVVEVRSETNDLMYAWSTIGQEIPNFTGTDVDFGLQTPDDGNDAAVHLFNSINRAHRYALADGQMNAAHTFCEWPAADPASGFYSKGLNEIHLGSDQQWNEGAAIHEYGHRLAAQFSVLDPSNYVNGYCDTPKPGHCVWCPENPKDAWQEGFADWFASWALRRWLGDYHDVPVSRNDNRWDLELTSECSAGQSFPNASTEGYVGAILRDIEDATNEDEDGVLPDCDMDVLNMGAGAVFWVFRDGDPATYYDFIAGFRTLFGSFDSDLWATIQNSAPLMNFPEPAVSIVADAPSCRIVRPGETVQLSVLGDGSLDRYQWRRNGVSLTEGSPFTGVNTGQLTITNIQPSLAGDYSCFVRTCDVSSAITSTATHVRFDIPSTPSVVVSWGENNFGQVGNGATSTCSPPIPHPNLNDVIAVDGGRSFSMMLRNDGSLLTWGNEQNGELGDGGQPSGQVNSPTMIAINMVRIAAGKYFGLALGRNGRIKGWGANFHGQLFTGDQTPRSAPDTTVFFGCVKDIAAGDENALALLEDGTVWAVGYNEYGTLGNGTFGGTATTAQQVLGLSNVIDIEAAGFWCAALRADSTVWTWGINSWGQLGLGHYSAVAVPTQVPGLTSIKQISAGQDNLYALRSDGRAFATGYGPAIGIGWDGGSSNVPQLLALTNITQIAGGSDWAMAVVGGQLKGWGLNAASYPPGDLGVLNVPGPYGQLLPIDVPGVGSVTHLWAGWGTAHAFGYVGVSDVTPTPDGPPIVLALAAAPNPSRATASIHFDLPTPGRVALSVYDVAGRRVRSLVDESFPVGRHVRVWDGTTDAGARVAAGVYFLHLSAPGGTLSRSFVRLD